MALVLSLCCLNAFAAHVVCGYSETSTGIAISELNSELRKYTNASITSLSTVQDVVFNKKEYRACVGVNDKG